MKPVKKPYSFSKIATYKQCPKKYFWNYIEKAPKSKTDITALLKGGAVHSILEHYPDASTHKLAPRYQYIADNFVASDLGKKYMHLTAENEIRVGLNSELEPCSYSDKTAVFRGIVDYVCLLGTLHLVDWKTGKLKEPKWQEYDQLMYYAVFFFKKYPNINQINISFVYVEHNSENSLVLDRQYLNNYIEQLTTSIEAIENEKVFPKNKSRLCEWCDFGTYCSAN